MLLVRNFVTVVVVVGSLFLVSCKDKKKEPSKAAAKEEMVEQGNEKIERAFNIVNDLEVEFGIVLLPVQTEATTPGGRSNREKSASNYNWRRLSKDERLAVKQNLAEYVSLASQVLAIDTQKLLYVEVEQKVSITLTLKNAQSFQNSLETFEKWRGENYEFKGDRFAEPIYFRLDDARKKQNTKKPNA